MDLLTLLNQNERILLEDNIEDKKVKALIGQINREIVDLMEVKENFEKYAQSQLSGEMNNKIATAKGLMLHYANWTAMLNAAAKLEQEEKNLVADFQSRKNKILADIHAVVKASEKSPVVCAYDCFDGDYVACAEGHYVVALGHNNTAVLHAMAKDFDYGLQIQGNYGAVEAKDLTADYSVVLSNSAMLSQKIDELYGSKGGKAEKLRQAVVNLEEEGRKVVFFVTYRKALEAIGVSKKDIDAYEKFLTKRYLPYKNLLRKACKTEIPEIAVEIQVANEESFGSADDAGFVPVSEESMLLKMKNIENFAKHQVQFHADAADAAEVEAPAQEVAFEETEEEIEAEYEDEE